jgi:type II secretory pathway component GspD/PulD (secretin)
VLIKAEFVDVQINDLDDFGIQWQLQPAGNLSATTTALGTAGSITLAYASGSAVANLRATLNRRTTNVLQAPIITTTNNRAAFVVVSESVPIFSTIQQVTNNVVNNVEQVNFIQVSNGLQVTPHINGDTRSARRGPAAANVLADPVAARADRASGRDACPDDLPAHRQRRHHGARRVYHETG